MSSHDEQDLLTQELHHRSAGVGGHPIDMDDVRGRARTIRRRRNAVRGVVAAMVAAVAVPAGLSLTDSLSSTGSVAPPVSSETVAPSPDAPTPQPAGTFPLTIRDLPRGEAPGLSYVLNEGDQLVTPRGSFDLQESYSMMTPYAGGWLAIGSSRHPGDVIMLDADLEVTHTDPAGGYEIAVSQDGSHVAYTVREGNDRILLVNAPTDGTDVVTWTIDVPRGESLDPVGFLDDDTVVYNSDTADVMGIARTGGTLTPIEGLRRIDDASEATGLVSGLVSFDDATSSGCSGVMDPESGDLLWQSCDHSLLRFSPDGRFVVAAPSYYDGPGPSSLSVLDASTGEPLVEFSPERGGRTVVGVAQSAWEDADTVLALVSEGEDQAMVRMELDGSLEAVTDTFTMRDLSVALWFAQERR